MLAYLHEFRLFAIIYGDAPNLFVLVLVWRLANGYENRIFEMKFLLNESTTWPVLKHDVKPVHQKRKKSSNINIDNVVSELKFIFDTVQRFYPKIRK